MFKIIIICFCVFVVVIADSKTIIVTPYEPFVKVGSKINTLENIGDANLIFPGTDVTLMKRKTEYGNIRYMIGTRVQGDRLVSQINDNTKWPTFHDVELNLHYPESNYNNSVVTCVEIVAGQSSNIGQAYVLSGGVGERFIEIVVEAKSTLWFEYKAEFFGY